MNAVNDVAIGEVLDGTWRLEAMIGQGGMGRVFRATDLKLGRQAAIKVLSVGHLDDETVKRFEREAQVMAKLRHRGVVTLYSQGRAHGVPWIAMQFLEGRSLWKVLGEHGTQLPPEVLLPIARQLLVTLSYIHGQKLIHRDLKPSNIHVAPHGHVTLLDLGLARGHKSTLTKTGVVWGTPDYMAPEQIAGERELDGRADLYALSVVLYRMLAGKPPFPETDDQDLLRAHMTKPRPDISKVVPGLSILLGAALQKGLAIHPEDRFQSAEEMLTTLERAMAARARDAPTVATPKPSANTEPHPVLIRPVVISDPDLVPTDAVIIPPNLRAPAAGKKVTLDAMPIIAPAPPPSIVHAGRTEPLDAVVQAIAAEGGLKGGKTAAKETLLDDDDGEDIATNPDGFLPLQNPPQQITDPNGFEPLQGSSSQSTDPNGFEPVLHTPPMPAPVPPPKPAPKAASTLVDEVAVPVVPAPAPSGPVSAATPANPEPAHVPALPSYLKPHFLLGAAVLLILIGVVLGKLL